MVTRATKILLLAGVDLLYALIVFNNLTDFDANYDFVRHVVSMDTTGAGGHGMWRAMPSPAVYLVFYWSVIAWEVLTTVLLSWGVIILLRALRQPALAFNASKRTPVLALTLSLLMWLVAFLAIGGEWFLMWLSHAWNGQQEAFRNFTIVAIVLLILLQPDVDAQP
jgi:predicted small integral membrane protein